jgi:hypothetical protein
VICAGTRPTIGLGTGSLVIAGLDPAIHLFARILLRR